MGRRIRTAIAVAASPVMVLVTAMGMGTAGATTRAPDKGGAPDRDAQVVTLVTGDKVILRGKGFAIRPGPGRTGIRFQRSQGAGHHYVIPSDVLPLLGSGRLDQRLFDVALLLKWRYDDAHRASVPLIVERGAGVRATAVPGLKVSHSLPTLGLDAAEVPKSAALQVWPKLAGASGVTKISLDGQRKALLDRSTKQIGAPAAWRRGLTGKGVTVAVVDTGVDSTHPDLRGVVTGARGFTERGPGDTKDKYGHGTHVASTVAGSGAASQGKYKGVAPGAKIVSAKVLDDSGSGSDSWILAGMEWAVTQGRAKVVNLSLGGADSQGLDVLERGVNTLSARTGALFVIAAGNDGDTETISSPASADAALAVGAVDRADRLAAFSSRGPRMGDGAVKPDLTAPGVGIAAARAAGVPAEEPVGTRYMRASGTSMATPHVAGAAAILAQQHPGWAGGRLKSALIGSAKPGARMAALDQGAGRVDLSRAINARVTSGTPNLSTYLRWPQSAPRTRQVTYINDSGSPVTLRLALKPDQAVGRGAFKLDRTTLTVPARGRAAARLTVTARGVRPGAYSGVITATGRGVSVRTIVGAFVEPKSHDLTVKAVDAAGRPASGTLAVFDKGFTRMYMLAVDRGSGRIRLPDGEHTLAGEVGQYERCAPLMVLHRTVRIARDTTLNLDVRQGKTVRMTVDEPTAQPAGYWDVNLIYRGAADRGYGFTYFTSCPAGIFRLLPVKQRGLDYYSHTTWSKKGSTEKAPSPYRYDLYDYRAGELPADPAYAARTTDLAAVKTTVKGQGTPLTGLAWLGAEMPGFDGGYISSAESIRAPAAQTYYLTSDPRFKWHQDFEYGKQDHERPASSGRISEPTRTFVKGGRYEQTWNAAVVGPGATGYLSQDVFDGPFGVREGNDLVVGASGVFGDGVPGRFGHDREATGTMTLARDGRVIKRQPLKDGELYATVPAAAATYTVTTAAARNVPYSILSTKVDAEWRFRSARTSKESALPLRSVGFGPRGLDNLNRARGGSLTTIPVWVSANQGTGPVKVKTLKVWASSDDGRTWQQVKLTQAGKGWTTEVHNPASGFVSLRAEMADDAGNSVKQTVIRAYAIGG